MAEEVDDLLSRAMGLPEALRLELAGSLLASLDASNDTDVEDAWWDEAEKRVREIDSGAVRLIGLEEALERLRRL